MKDVMVDANFPRTAEGRVYHVGIKAGELANRIITVGDPNRALAIAKHFDPEPVPFQLRSERGFLTVTGKFKGVDVSVVAIGMGLANMDFFVRECKECIQGDSAIMVRFGSCGCITDLPVGSLVVPHASVAVIRNYDFDFLSPPSPTTSEKAYLISKPVAGDPDLHKALINGLEETRPKESKREIRGDCVNASTDSFYSSQGRLTAFPDHNENLIDNLAKIEGLKSLEMETFHLYHLASMFPYSKDAPSDTFKMRAGAVQMVFAARPANKFITPAIVQELEPWVGLGCLNGIISLPI